MNNPFLIGERIYLRALVPDDVNGNYVEWLNDAQVCQYNSHHVFPYSKEKAIEYIKEISSTRDAVVLAIVLKENDLHIGNISLQCIDCVNRNAELAILLGEKQYWGKGLSKEAGFLLLQHGFNELNLVRIYCGTSSDNTAMQNLATSFGMKEEGRRRQALFKHRKFIDVIEYGLLRDEFFEKLK